MNMLEIRGISKSFGNKEVLKKLSLSVEEGSVYGFVGLNGAGKTTTMKLILGLLRIDEGEILVNGEKVLYGQNKTNEFIGYLPDVPEFYSYMTAYEYLDFCGQIMGMEKCLIKERIKELLDLVGLENEKSRIKAYSRGMKQRLGIAQALINKPKLLICDEPTSALDPIGRREILDILRKSKGETTVLFSTHILSDVEKICDEVAFIYEGRIALSGNIEDIKSKYSNQGIIVETMEENDLLNLMNNFSNSKRIDNKNILFEGDEEYIREIMSFIIDNKIGFNRIEKEEKNLETLFMEVMDR